jgi:hypothetical protein
VDQDGTGLRGPLVQQSRALARTEEPTRIAALWAMTTGSLVAGFWNEQTTDRIERYRLTERRAAHRLALMHDGRQHHLPRRQVHVLAHPTVASTPDDPTHDRVVWRIEGNAGYVFRAPRIRCTRWASAPRANAQCATARPLHIAES